MYLFNQVVRLEICQMRIDETRGMSGRVVILHNTVDIVVYSQQTKSIADVQSTLSFKNIMFGK